MEIGKKDKEKARQLTKEVKLRIRDMFEQHRSKVDQANNENKYGRGQNKNETSSVFYSSLNDLIGELRIVVVIQMSSVRT